MESVFHPINATAQKDGWVILALKVNLLYVFCFNISCCSELVAICTSSCLNGNCTLPDTCTCNIGWEGSTCIEGSSDLYCLRYS